MLQITVWCPTFTEYQVTMSKDKAGSSSDSLHFKPAWIGSSTLLIKGEELCDVCTYYILIYPK